MTAPITGLEHLADTIAARKGADPETSWTAKLLAKGPEKCAGGMMAYRIACELSGTFKAVASVTGTDNVPGCRPNNPVSVLHIHAQNDTHVLFNGGAGKDVFKDETMVTDFTSVPDTFRMWKERYSCTGQPARVLDVEGAY